MKDTLSYLINELGLSVAANAWEGANSLPIHLAKAADYWWCVCDGTEFITAKTRPKMTLPDLKRISVQLEEASGLPVLLASDEIDSRQRKALVSQGIPFVVPRKQAYIPFLALAATASAKQRSFKEKLSPSAQAVLVTLAADQELSSFEALKNKMRLTASSISRGIDELAKRGIIKKSKEGRRVLLSFDKNGSSLLRSTLPHLRNPIAHVRYVRRCKAIEGLPLAGESALACRSMLVAPKVEQRAVSKEAFSKLDVEELLLGEIEDAETVQIQLWSYDPLVAGGSVIDDVSLALSLVKEGDERVIGELNSLFGEEDLWQ